MGDVTIPPGGGAGEDGSGIEPVDLRAALEERYLAYALSTIMNRALPDVREGLAEHQTQHIDIGDRVLEHGKRFEHRLRYAAFEGGRKDRAENDVGSEMAHRLIQ